MAYAVRIKTDQGWQDIAIQGATGSQGPQGIQGPQGVKGDTGAAGGPLIIGGTTGQLLAKKTNADYDAQWVNPPVTGITGQTYTMSGYVADRVLNAGATSIAELANVLATLIDDMKAAGLIKP